MADRLHQEPASGDRARDSRARGLWGPSWRTAYRRREPVERPFGTGPRSVMGGAARKTPGRAWPLDSVGDAAGSETQKSWRRPIFPKGCPLSIFGAGELNFRVRDGNGCGLSASVTRICACIRVSAATQRKAAQSANLKNSDSVVQGSPRSASDPWSVLKEVKPSTISTAQLHPSPDFHMPPIKQVVSLRSYPVDPVGNLILRRASHLDAFSAYPDRT